MSFWGGIEQYLTDKGFSAESLDSLRRFIDAPAEPPELSRALNNLLELLKYLDALAPKYPEHLTDVIDPRWNAITRAILAHPYWESEVPAVHKKGKKPLWGFYVKNQAYAALWTRPSNESDWSYYFTLLAHVCVAAANLRRWMQKQSQDEKLTRKEIADFKYRIRQSFLTVRKLADAENLHILRSLNHLEASPDKLLKILQNNSLLHEELTLLFVYLLEIKKPARRRPIDGRQPRHRRKSPKLESPAYLVDMGTNLDPELEGLIPSVEVFQLPTSDEKEARDIESAGCLPRESVSGTEIIFSKGADKKILSPQQKANLARQMKSLLSMRNQLLPFRWESLSLYEISSFIEAVNDLIKKRDKSIYFPGYGNSGELAALLFTIFWCGQHLEDIIKFRCYKGSVPNDMTEPGFVAESDSTGYWWMVPALRLRKILPDEDQKTKANFVISAYPIASGTMVESMISSYVHYIHRYKSEYLFPNLRRNYKNYEEMVRSFLSKVNRHYGTRLTVNRVADYLFDKISRRKGADLTTAMYLTGRQNFLGSNLSSYTAIMVYKLQTTYTEVCRDILDSYCKERSLDNVGNYTPITLPFSDAYVGSPFVPTKKTIKELVGHLKEKLQGSASSKPNIQKLIDLHNNMTSYTAYLIGFCTGFRAIRDPFLSSAEIDWRTGFAILSDKDNEDRYNSRMIWIPPVCLEQLKHFREHTHNALYRFSILLRDLYSQLEPPRRQGPGRYMYFAQVNKDTGSYETQNFGPKLVGQGLEEIYPLPFNASRHYLRSQLLNNRCPVEVINALMGHFERGEEPWGTYSGLSPLSYRNALKRHLLPLIEAARWEALAGLGSAL